jgi:hypothetical protein
LSFGVQISLSALEKSFCGHFSQSCTASCVLNCFLCVWKALIATPWFFSACVTGWMASRVTWFNANWQCPVLVCSRLADMPVGSCSFGGRTDSEMVAVHTYQNGAWRVTDIHARFSSDALSISPGENAKCIENDGRRHNIITNRLYCFKYLRATSSGTGVEEQWDRLNAILVGILRTVSNSRFIVQNTS